MQYEKAGYYRLRQFLVTSYNGNKKADISDNVIEFDLTESIYADSILVTAVILDSSNFIENFPVLGEEFVTIETEDIFGIRLTHHLFLYAVANQSFGNKDQTTTYKIYLSSVERFFSDRSKKIRRSFSGIPSDIVDNIFYDCIKYDPKASSLISYSPLIQTEENTSPIASVNIPRLSPFESIRLIAAKTFADYSIDNSFMFFQNRSSYWFSSISNLNRLGTTITTPLDETTQTALPYHTYTFVSGITEKDSRGYGKHYSNFTDLKIKSRINTLDSTRNQYKSLVNTVNPALGGAQNSEADGLDASSDTIYDYVEELSRFGYNIPRHSVEFVGQTYRDDNVQTFDILDTYSRIGRPEGADRRYKELMNQRITFTKNFNEIVLEAQAYGFNAIYAGAPLRFNMNRTDQQLIEFSTRNEFLTGDYLITKIIHKYNIEGDHMMTLTLNKIPYVDNKYLPDRLASGLEILSETIRKVDGL